MGLDEFANDQFALDELGSNPNIHISTGSTLQKLVQKLYYFILKYFKEIFRLINYTKIFS